MNEPRSALKGARILIVEDDSQIAGLLTTLLSGYGYEVVGPALDIPNALRLASREDVQAALLDLEVAGKSASAVAQALSDRDIPFAWMTGHPKSDIAARFRRQPRLQKPFSGIELARLLGEIIRRQASAAQHLSGRSYRARRK